MRICALLCWFDEPVELLDRCVSSLAGVADHLVALDGRWERFPSEAVSSDPAQRTVIAQACARAGITGTIVTPGMVFPSQVAKRTMLLELAPADADWLLVIDGDEHIWTCDRPALDEALEQTLADVARLPLTNLARYWPLNQLPEHTYSVRRLFRAAARPRYERAHNGVRAADGRWLSGESRYATLADAVNVHDLISLGHACDARSGERDAQRVGYYRTRAAEKFEEWAVA